MPDTESNTDSSLPKTESRWRPMSICARLGRFCFCLQKCGICTKSETSIKGSNKGASRQTTKGPCRRNRRKHSSLSTVSNDSITGSRDERKLRLSHELMELTGSQDESFCCEAISWAFRQKPKKVGSDDIKDVESQIIDTALTKFYESVPQI